MKKLPQMENERQAIFNLGISIGSGLSAIQYIRLRSQQALRAEMLFDNAEANSQIEEENSKVRQLLLKASQLAVYAQLISENKKD